ncbi:MAG: DUF4402 domain-containing protein [Actinobacteria bacterium]|nr:DUF4402 domain-containing protein [Actinomycetota bacterium]
MRGLLLSLLLALGLAAAVTSADSAGGGTRPRPAAAPPVASLEPAKTAALWSRLTARPHSRTQAPAACRPLRGVFYAASDWLRLATKLAATRSQCAEYHVSIPPLVADKTQPRPNQAWRIRALGPQFHALAEIHFTTWSRWVASTGNTWHAAGVTARERMAAAGYDVAQGDSWMLNELTSAVRRGDGDARAAVREFLRGLYEGDGSRPTRGAVLVIGFGQRTGDVSAYQDTLQSWLGDSVFWTDIATYVSDWSQEVYGDFRSFAIPGAAQSVRRDYLNDYLQHKLVLAGAGPETIEPARAYLREAHSPLANAAWPREGGWGWTMVPVEQMTAYVSAQVHALRYFSAAAGQARDHWGFAWAPRNTTGLSNADFGAQTSAILDRLGAAVRDSGDAADPEDPGSAACGPSGQNVWCVGDHAEGRPNEAWKSFRAWTQAVLTVSPAQALTAGTPSRPINLSLATSTGLPVPNRTTLTVTLSSSSPQGRFSTSPAGPWTPTLTLTLPVGASAAAFHYLDTLAGSHVLTASAAGATSGTQTVTVAPAAAVAVRVSPVAGEIRVRGTRRFTATALDPYENAVPASFTWRVTPAGIGQIAPEPGGTATFTAGRLLRKGIVDASGATAAGTITGSAHFIVTPARLEIRSIEYRAAGTGVQVTVTARDGARRPVSHALVRVLVRRDGRRHFTGRAVTGASGRSRYAVRARGEGCFTVKIRSVRAAGFRWDGRTPRNRFCL